MAEGPVKFGILGVGRIVQSAFAPGLAQTAHAVLHAAASRDLARAKSLSPARAYDSYEALLADPDVEAVYVAVQNSLHHPLTMAALEAGKHVLCEKPLGCTVAECEEMATRARERKLHLVEAFMYRYHPRIDQALEWVRSGKIGSVRTVEASFSFRLNREHDVRWNKDFGGGSALDVGCYCVNFCRLVLGDEPRRVTARAQFHPRHAVDLSMQGILEYGDGEREPYRTGVVSCGFDGGLRNRALICGTEGVVELPKAFIQWNESSEAVLVTSAGEERVPFPAVHVFQAEIEDLVNAIRHGGTPRLAPGEGVANLRILERMKEAASHDGN